MKPRLFMILPDKNTLQTIPYISKKKCMSLSRHSLILAACFSFSMIKTAYQATIYPEDLFSSLNLQAQQLREIHSFLDNQEDGCHWIPEYPIIGDLIETMHLKVGCEIGVAYGGQSEYLLQHTTVNTLYSIDPYRMFNKGEYNDFLNFQQAMHDVLFLRVQHKLSPFVPRSVLIRKTSEEAVNDFEVGSLDFVYIDANHAYEYVKQDLKLWVPKVRSGGLISGDDFKVWPGVAKAVKEFLKEYGLKNLQTKGNKWWFVKP